MEVKDDKGQMVIDDWANSVRKRKEEVRISKIRESKSAGDYEKWAVKGIPKYLAQKGKGEKMKMIVRFRCYNELRGNRYWEKEDKRRCRICKKYKDTLQHVAEECEGTKEIGRRTADLMKEGGEGIDWMQRIMKERERRQKEEDMETGKEKNNT